MKPLGEQLTELLGSARSRVFVVAPFIKLHALQRVISTIPEGVDLACITRWEPTEIAAGVSDISVWPLLASRKKSQLLILRHLHAKYYCADSNALIGSANVTGAALGWSRNPNVELLVKGPRLESFESSLLSAAVPVTDELYRRMELLAARLSTDSRPPYDADVLDDWSEVSEPEEQPLTASPEGLWIPSTRNPEDLYLAYSRPDAAMTEALPDSVWLDITFIRAPSGLDRASFEAYTAAALIQSAFFREVEVHLTSPRRFGYMRSNIRKLLSEWSVERDATRVWQTTLRWLTYFLPDDFEVFVANYSEIIRRRR